MKKSYFLIILIFTFLVIHNSRALGQCTPPATPTANGITINCGDPATLTASGSTGNYEWFSDANGNNSMGTGNSISLGNLYADSTVYVAATAGSSCAPQIETFDNQSIPSGWTSTNSIASTSANAFWKYGGVLGYNMNPTNDHTGNNGSFAWVDGSSPYPAVVTLNSPTYPQATYTSLSFYMKRAANTTITNFNSFSVDFFNGTAWYNAIFTHNTSTANSDWEQFSINLASISISGNVRFRFNVNKNGTPYPFYDDIAIDDVELVCGSSSCLSNLVPVTVTVNGPTPPTANGITINCGDPATLTASGSTGNYEWFSDANGNNSMGTGNSISLGNLYADSTVYVAATSGSQAGPPTVIYNEDWQNGNGGWTLGNSGPYWNRISGGTTSSATGPNGGSTNGVPTNGNFYVYLETSTGAGTAYLTGPGFTITGAATLEFDYHMYGATMGTLALEVFDGTSWTQVWSLSGQQQNSNAASWTTVSVPLTNYTGNINIRFSGQRGSSFTGDMAIDNISISETQTSPSCFSSLVPVTVTVNGPTPPTANGITINCGDPATLTASGSTGNYEWFSDANGNNSIGTGNSISLGNLYADSTVYVASTSGSSSPGSATFTYTGAVQNWTVPTGVTQIDIAVWGAEGGGSALSGNGSSGQGGKGGYSSGTLNVTPGEVLSIYVGGHGASSTSGVAAGGFNGGGSGYASSSGEPGNGGGGASDVRQGGNALPNRVIVAGGGGGGGEDSGDSFGHGGGLNGVGYSATYDASQTGAGLNGALGQGATTISGDGGGGGGGYYGGGTNQSTSIGGDTQGGGGGSGYIGGVSNGQTIAGNASMPNPAGGTMIGRSGHGLVQINYSASGCASGLTPVTVTVNGPAGPILTPSSQPICEGNNVVINASGAPSNSTYTWYSDPNGNTQIGTGATYTTPILNSTTTYYAQIIPPATQATVHIFTNAGATGRQGPTQTQINNAYSSTNLSGQVTSVNGIQYWTVPQTGTYTIEAVGAQGGGSNGGLGATMIGDFQLNQNDVLQIIVGQEGLVQNGQPNSVGGGGGTFVVKSPANTVNDILVIAGGGGGSPATYSSLRNAVTGVNGNNGAGASSFGNGGSNGNGGNATQRSGGGAGFLTNGQSSTQTAASAEGGYSFLNGGEGGNHNSNGIAGSFGGGGAAWQTGFRGAGGGGGYSGGGGAQVTSNNSSISGGGGGSINNGTNQVNTAGNNTGNGYVKITFTPSASTQCASVIDSVQIQVDQKATAPTSISGTTSICSGQPVTLTATGGSNGSGAIYEWGTGNTIGSNIITGQNSSTITVNPTTTTTYWVRRVSNTSCNTITGGVTVTITVNQPNTIITVANNTAVAGDFIWNGQINNDWNNPTNWYLKTTTNYIIPSVPPTLSDNVFVVPSSVGGSCISASNTPIVNVLTLGSGFAKDVFIHANSQLALDNNTTLDVTGDFYSYGQLIAGTNSTIRFTGNDSADLYINDPINNKLYNIELNKTTSTIEVELQTDIYLDNEVKFIMGNLRLNQKIVDLGYTGYFDSENENSHAYCDCPTAKIRRRIPIPANTAVDAGNLGLEITPSVNMGTVLVERSHLTIIDPLNNMPQSIVRYYNVKDVSGNPVQNNGNLGANIVFHYLNANLGGLINLSLYHKPINQSIWDEYGGTHNPTNKTVTYPNLQSFSLVTLAEFNSPLPVKLISFNSECVNGLTSLKWQTASEVNSDYFQIERSIDGIDWYEISKVTASGFSNNIVNYEFTDINSEGFVGYYRLKQVDFDGKFEYSNFIYVSNNNCLQDNNINIYPNPAKNNIQITFNENNSSFTSYSIIDVIGKTMLSGDLMNISFSKFVDINTLPKGIYFVNIYSKDKKVYSHKLIKM